MAVRLPDPESHLVCIHVLPPPARRRPDGPADPVPPCLARSVRQVGGCELGVQLASGLLDHPPAQLRVGWVIVREGVIADQPLRQRRVDGVSTRCPRGSADDRPVRHDGRFPAVAAVVVQDGRAGGVRGGPVTGAGTCVLERDLHERDLHGGGEGTARMIPRGPADARDNVVMRFAVVRRERLAAGLL
jgi:hypothetical protein